MTAFHLPILFGPPRLDMPETDASFLHGEGEGQREFCAIVHLYLANGKREHLTDRGQKLETGAVIFAGIEAQDPIPGTVIEGRVLKIFLAGDFHLLDIDLHTLAGVLFAEENGVAWTTRIGAPNGRIAEVPADPAESSGRCCAVRFRQDRRRSPIAGVRV